MRLKRLKLVFSKRNIFRHTYLYIIRLKNKFDFFTTWSVQNVILPAFPDINAYYMMSRHLRTFHTLELLMLFHEKM